MHRYLLAAATLLLQFPVTQAAQAIERLPPGSITWAKGAPAPKDLASPDYPPSCFDGPLLPSYAESFRSGTAFHEFDAEVVDQQNPGVLRAPVNIRLWRVPCHLDGSALLVEFQRLGGLPLAPEIGIRNAGEENDAFRARISYEANTRITDDTNAIIPVFADSENRTVYVLAATPGAVAAGVDFDGEVDVLVRTRVFDAILRMPAYDPAEYGVEGFMAVHPRLTGSWYNIARQGEGVFVEVFEEDDGDRGLFVAWYTYRDGAQQWLVGSAEFAPGARSVTVPVLRTSGASFGSEFSTFDVVEEPWGTLTLGWLSCARLELAYEGLDEAGSLSLSRLTTIAGFDCR
ncbi:MAG: hypothetical protein AAGE01_08755 [Pseudomonadota bacterium]